LKTDIKELTDTFTKFSNKFSEDNDLKFKQVNAKIAHLQSLLDGFKVYTNTEVKEIKTNFVPNINFEGIKADLEQRIFD